MIQRLEVEADEMASFVVRSALSFSNKLDNHIGTIKLFICHYNLTKATA
jgi:hypothetical protein